MDFTKLTEMVDLADGQELTDETAQDVILGTLMNRKTRIGELEAEIATLKQQAVTIAASHKPGKAAELHPQLLSLATDNRKMKLAALMDGGAIDAAARTRLEELFVGTNGGALKLSLQSGTPDQFDAVIDILAENKPVSLGEKTGAQTLRLSHAVNDPKQNELLADAQRRAAAAKAG